MTLSVEVLPEDAYSIKFNIIKDLINDSNDIIDNIPKSFEEDVSKYWTKVNNKMFSKNKNNNN